ncbi:hypothetical protein [Sphingomonas colocasiae]|uniref:DUF4402 domain-containing protein n=1 Tax=Sphingomonas colocasiae TaxID=1848973 RepID=A0ABS7PXM2_9SPHN|nr:hypothetical protein [Sphingomonas colocasiae]MBY8826122.1 hypothetical protein [Sphingomonas colocasiae]
MATALSASLSVSLAGILANILDIGSANYPINFNPNVVFTDGAGAGQANKIFTDTRSLAASASEDLDLNGTTLIDAFGNAMAMTKLKALIVYAAPGNTNDVVVGGASSNGVFSMFGASTDTVKVKPGGFLVLAAPTAAGYAVTAATADLLKIANGSSGSGVTYTIVLIGA